MSQSNAEGYVLIASDSQHYLELAVNAACSLRFNDSRPIALLVSGGVRVPAIYRELFDFVVAFDPEPRVGSMFVKRFDLEKYTPFQRAMHIDADCLLVGNDIDRFWAMFAGKPFGVFAQYQDSGKCYRDQIDIDAIRRAGIAKGVYVTNWGVFYYENSGFNPVLKKAKELLELERSEALDVRLSYFSRPQEYSDEPFWGIALSQLELDISPHDYGNLLQCTSPNTADWDFDYEKRKFEVTKGGLTNVRGEIFHFANLNPLQYYLRGINFYRTAKGIPLPTLIVGSEALSPDYWISRICLDSEIYEPPRQQPIRFEASGSH